MDTATWMALKNMMLCKRKETPKNTYYINELISNFKTRKSSLLWYKVKKGLPGPPREEMG